MNYPEIYTKANQWMVGRGWREVYGKRGSFTQSLLQHTDIELNMLLELLPILAKPEHYNLSEHEQQALIVGQIVHDVGKETDEWQTYVRSPRERQRGRYVPHVLRPLTDEAVADLVFTLGFPESAINDAVKFVNLHMVATRNPANVIHAAIQPSGSHRWNMLARIVDTIDNIASIPGLLATLQAIERDQNGGAIGPHIDITYHLVNQRGVTSALLHKAAEEAYRERGWRPFAYFSDGTIYISDCLSNAKIPSAENILLGMSTLLESFFEDDHTDLIVSKRFNQTVIPKPEFFNVEHLEKYLRVASTRLSSSRFRAANYPKESAPSSKVLELEDKRNKIVSIYLSELGRLGLPSMQFDQLTQEEVEREVDRIAELQPDIAIWIFFSAADKLGLLGDLRESFNQILGPGSYEKFKKCPKQQQYAKNVVYGVDIFGKRKASEFGNYSSGALIELFPTEDRVALLIETLQKVVEQAKGDAKRPNANEIAAEFDRDLLHPLPIALTSDPLSVAAEQFAGYSEGKRNAYSKGARSRLCPVCNCHFETGTVATKDIVDSPKAHTNRGVSHGPENYIIICNACKYERMLQQLLLGEKVASVLVLAPRNHIGRCTGELLVREVLRFSEIANDLMSNSTTNPNENLTLALTNVIAGKIIDNDDITLNKLVRAGFGGEEVASVLTYQLRPDNQKKYQRKLFKALCEDYGFDKETSIEEWNVELGSEFITTDDMVDAIISRKYTNEVVDDIRQETYRLYPRLQVVCQTPNFILIPSKNDFNVKVNNKNESETNAALRELFTTLLIGLAFDCSVATVKAGELPTFSGGEGIAQVPSVPAVRTLIGNDWVGLAEARLWIEKIGAASLLANATAYPERSNLYQILVAPTAGHILRRIEMKSDSGRATLNQIRLIQKATQSLS